MSTGNMRASFDCFTKAAASTSVSYGCSFIRFHVPCISPCRNWKNSHSYGFRFALPFTTRRFPKSLKLHWKPPLSGAGSPSEASLRGDRFSTSVDALALRHGYAFASPQQTQHFFASSFHLKQSSIPVSYFSRKTAWTGGNPILHIVERFLQGLANGFRAFVALLLVCTASAWAAGAVKRNCHLHPCFPFFDSVAARSGPSALLVPHFCRNKPAGVSSLQARIISSFEYASFQLEGTELAMESRAEMHLLMQEPMELSFAGGKYESAPTSSGTGRRIKGNAFVKSAAGKVGPAVVRLDTERTAAITNPVNRDGLNQWFGAPSNSKSIRERGMGSGFVIDGKQGLIVTNSHVVNGAEHVKVMFSDGRSFEGQVIGMDEVTDLAVVKVLNKAGELLPEAPLGNSKTVELGDWVIGVGNPFGLDNTISLGIISNLHRTAFEVGISGKRLDLFQTDCAINPGNSGGPLVNEFGEVIGINTAIRADAEGIAFAIPINNVKHVIQALGEGSTIRHPYLGIQMATITSELARKYNRDAKTEVLIPEAEGVLVLKIFPESPAAVAGFEVGDVIVELEGEMIFNVLQLQRLIQRSSVDQVLNFGIWRGNKNLGLDVKTCELTPWHLRKEDAEGLNGPYGYSSDLDHSSCGKISTRDTVMA